MLQQPRFNSIVSVQKDNILSCYPSGVQYGIPGFGWSLLWDFSENNLQLPAKLFLLHSQNVPGSIGRTIVVNQNFKILKRLGHEFLEAGFQIFLKIIGGDGHCNFRHPVLLLRFAFLTIHNSCMLPNCISCFQNRRNRFYSSTQSSPTEISIPRSERLSMNRYPRRIAPCVATKANTAPRIPLREIIRIVRPADNAITAA